MIVVLHNPLFLVLNKKSRQWTKELLCVTAG